MEFEILYWHWVILGIVLVVAEVFLASFFILWFGAAALIIGGLVFFVPSLSLTWQVLAWTVLSCGLALAWFKYLKPLSVDRTRAGLSRETLLGEAGQVLTAPLGNKRGILRFPAPVLGSDEWEFISQDELAPGDRVSVSEVSGNTLIVGKFRPPNTGAGS